MMRKAMRFQWIKGFGAGAVGHDGVEISQLRYLRVILLLFEMISRLKINMGKSSVFAVNEVHNIQGLGDVLGCQIGELPTEYLGMPLGARYKAKQV